MEKNTIKSEEEVWAGVPFINDEEKIKYKLLDDFYHILVIPAISQEIDNKWGYRNEDPSYSEECYGDFVYSEFEDQIGRKWVELMSNYMPDLWNRMNTQQNRDYEIQLSAADSNKYLGDLLPF